MDTHKIQFKGKGLKNLIINVSEILFYRIIKIWHPIS